MNASDLDVLERRLSELFDRCEVLSRENHALSQLQSSWTIERAKLIEKNELAKSKEHPERRPGVSPEAGALAAC